MMSTQVSDRQKFYGLLELDPDGMVLYSRREKNGDVGGMSDMRGYNFYSEVAYFDNVEEFRHCLDDFRKGSKQANTIDFNCHYADSSVHVRILLSRISERSGQGVTKSILVHIREAK